MYRKGTGSPPQYYSTFPTTVDTFVKLESHPNAGSLETAEQWNRMFDAALAVEKHLLASGTHPLRGIEDDGGELAYVTGANFVLGFDSVVVTLGASGGSTDFTVPADFGSTPATDTGFAIGHSTSIQYPATDRRSDYASVLDESRPPFSDAAENFDLLYRWPQLTTLISPVSGRTFRVTVRVLNPGKFGLGLHEFRDSCNYSGYSVGSHGATWGIDYPIDYGAQATEYKTYRGWTCFARQPSSAHPTTTNNPGIEYLTPMVSQANGGNSLCLYSCEGTFGVGGWIYCGLDGFSSQDQEVEFTWWRNTLNSEVEVGAHTGNPVGPMVRMTGSYHSATAWGVVLMADGSVSDGTARAQIVQFTADDIAEQKSGGGWELDDLWLDGFDPVVETATYYTADWNGLTSDASGNAYCTLTAGYRYRLKADGGTIEFSEQKTPGGPWLKIGEATDASPAAGRMGFFVRPAYGYADRKTYVSDIVCRNLDGTAPTAVVSVVMAKLS